MRYPLILETINSDLCAAGNACSEHAYLCACMRLKGFLLSACMHNLCLYAAEEGLPGPREGFIKVDNCRVREACLIDFHYPVSSLSHEINTNGIRAHQHWQGSSRRKNSHNKKQTLNSWCMCVSEWDRATRPPVFVCSGQTISLV